MGWPKDPSADFLCHDDLIKMVNYNCETGEFKWIFPFGGRKRSGRVFGYKDRDGYTRVTIKGKKIHIHRLAWFYHHGSWPKILIDHINGDTSDNRISNLREANFTHNQYNRKTNGKNLRGVCKKSSGKYEAVIRINGHTVYLGSFDTEEEAHSAYCYASDKSHGDFSFIKRFNKSATKCDIELYNNRYNYNIDGKVFSNLKEASVFFGISAPTISKRCKSSSWPDWSRTIRKRMLEFST